MCNLLNKQLMTEEELAGLLNCSRATLARWRCYGGGPPFIKVGERAVRYRLQEVEAWLAVGQSARES